MEEREQGGDTVFRSKVDPWIGLLLGGSVGSPLVLGLHRFALGDRTAGLVVLAASALALLPLALVLPVRYEVSSEVLTVRVGLLAFPVRLEAIERVVPRTGLRFTPGLSAAMSLDVLDVYYRQGRRSALIVISPRDWRAFVTR